MTTANNNNNKKNPRNYLCSRDLDIIVKSCKMYAKNGLPSKRVFKTEDGLTLEFVGVKKQEKKKFTVKVQYGRLERLDMIFDGTTEPSEAFSKVIDIVKEHSFSEER